MNRKILMIGLDGATYDIISPLINEGWMPNLAKLMTKGAYGPMLSTVPPISGPAWLSLATGLRPKTTSAYDFLYRKGKSYKLQHVSPSDYFGRSIWDFLSKGGRRVGILNYPMGGPPYEINGFMTSGLGISPEGGFTFPPDLEEELHNVAGGSYELMIPYHNPRYDNTELFIDDISRVLDKKLRATTYLLKKKQWDFFWVVISETDWLQHIMWRHIDENHPLYEKEKSPKYAMMFKKLWSRIDEAIGDFCDIVGDQTNIIIISDHGFGPNDQVFRLNAWLEREGYLVHRQRQSIRLHLVKKAVYSFVTSMARNIKLHRFFPRLYKYSKKVGNKLEVGVLGEIDLKKSTAFDPGHTIPFGGIYVNDQLFDDPRMRQKLVDEIARKLCRWGFEHDVKVEIWRENDLSNCPTNSRPDLIIGINNWRCVVIKDEFEGELFERKAFSRRHTGSHRGNGIFIATGPDIKRCTIDEVSVCDIAPSILYLFKQQIPSIMDGRVLEEIFASEYTQKNPPEFDTKIEGEGIGGQAKNALSMPASEDDTMRKQLKDLGYM